MNYMKKLANILVLSTVFSMLIYIGCKKSNTIDDKIQKVDQVPEVLPTNIDRQGRISTSPCGGFHNGTYYTINSYYTYPNQQLNTDCVDDQGNNDTITVLVWAQAVPNRFRIVDQNNNFIVSTGWLGTANYGGPWGASLSNTGTAVLTFINTPGSTYYIKVETVTPPNTSYYPNSDNWEAQVSCVCFDDYVVSPSCPCGGFFNGDFYTINQSYTYPLQLIPGDTCAGVDTVSITVWAKDIPNKFTLVSETGGNFTNVSNTGWLGTASYGGPWGSSISNTGTTTFYYVKAANTRYYIRVETLTPPNTGYTPNSDNWEFEATCL
jgi:hypothetical protein